MYKQEKAIVVKETNAMVQNVLNKGLYNMSYIDEKIMLWLC